MCCRTEIEIADQTFHLTQSQHTDTGLTSPSTYPLSSTLEAYALLTSRPARRFGCTNLVLFSVHFGGGSWGVIAVAFLDKDSGILLHHNEQSGLVGVQSGVFRPPLPPQQQQQQQQQLLLLDYSAVATITTIAAAVPSSSPFPPLLLPPLLLLLLPMICTFYYCFYCCSCCRRHHHHHHHNSSNNYYYYCYQHYYHQHHHHHHHCCCNRL